MIRLTMIPRYGPTYCWQDLLVSLRQCLREDPANDIRLSLSKLYGKKHVFLFNGARAALYAILRAYNRRGGVLIPAYNCIAVPEAVLYAGYRPVFADIGDESFNVTARTIEHSMRSDITVVLMTHQFGIPCQMDEIRELCRSYRVLVVEDAAAAIGARFQGQLAGTFGDAAIISFHMTKVVSGGIGGAVLTDDDQLADGVSRLLQETPVPQSHWAGFAEAATWKVASDRWLYKTVYSGYRVFKGERMFQVIPPQIEIPAGFARPCCSFTAALILNQLDRLNVNLERRRKLAQWYTDTLAGSFDVKVPVVRADCSPSWIQFPVVVSDKKAFYTHMQRHGIDLSWTFRYCCTDGFGLNGFPNARQAALQVVGLPTYPSLSDEQAWEISSAAKSFRSV